MTGGADLFIHPLLFMYKSFYPWHSSSETNNKHSNTKGLYPNVIFTTSIIIFYLIHTFSYKPPEQNFFSTKFHLPLKTKVMKISRIYLLTFILTGMFLTGQAQEALWQLDFEREIEWTKITDAGILLACTADMLLY
jgi:hypothetical protein